MRYSALLLLGLFLITLQGQAYALLGPIAGAGFRPSLLVPLLVYLGVTGEDLGLSAAVAFFLGYVLDLVGGSPVGLHAFTSVCTLVLARSAGARIVTQGGLSRALLAGVFAALGTLVVIMLVAIFGRSPWVPRALVTVVVPHAIATMVTAPLVFRLTAKVQEVAHLMLEPSRRTGERHEREAPGGRTRVMSPLGFLGSVGAGKPNRRSTPSRLDGKSARRSP